MSVRERWWGVVAAALIGLTAAALVGLACYQAGYQRGRREGRSAADEPRVTVQKETWEGSPYEQITSELDQCVRSLQAVTRNPKAFSAEEREYWREQTKFLVKTLEQGLLPRLAKGEKLEAYGELIDEKPVRRLVERAKKLLARMPT
jgi:hypothetical protein